MTYLELCRVDEVLPGDLRSFRINGKEVMLINSKGRFFCLDGRCTHAGAPLVEGELEEDILTCPWHGSRFRITDGTVVRGPATRGLQVYTNMVKDGYVLVEVL